MKTFLKSVVLIALGIVVGWGIFIWYPEYKEKNKTDNVELVEEKKTDETKSHYSNNNYKFALSYPKEFTLEQNENPGCLVIDDSHAEIPTARHQNVELHKGSKLTLEFFEVEKQEGDIVSVGSVGYVLPSPCAQNSLVSVQVLAKKSDFDMKRFLDMEVNTINEEFKDSAAGGGASKLTANLNGKEVTLIRAAGTSVMENTTDLYYFEGKEYVYILSHSYSRTVVLSMAQKDKDEHALEIQEYNLAREIISGFEVMH